jgi:hypothetical protein
VDQATADQATGWLLLGLAVLLVVAALHIRRRYGNPYAALTKAFERVTGLPMAAVVKGLGVLTLLAWAVIYLMFRDPAESGLDRLFHRVFDPPPPAGEAAGE